MIQLTRPDGRKVYFATDKVVQIEEREKGSAVNGMLVTEDADTVLVLLGVETYNAEGGDSAA